MKTVKFTANSAPKYFRNEKGSLMLLVGENISRPSVGGDVPAGYGRFATMSEIIGGAVLPDHWTINADGHLEIDLNADKDYASINIPSELGKWLFGDPRVVRQDFEMGMVFTIERSDPGVPVSTPFPGFALGLKSNDPAGTNALWNVFPRSDGPTAGTVVINPQWRIPSGNIATHKLDMTGRSNNWIQTTAQHLCRDLSSGPVPVHFLKYTELNGFSQHPPLSDDPAGIVFAEHALYSSAGVTDTEKWSGVQAFYDALIDSNLFISSRGEASGIDPGLITIAGFWVR